MNGHQRFRHLGLTNSFDDRRGTPAETVVPIALEVSQELQDELRRDVRELHGHRLLAQLLSCVPEGQRHPIAVAGHCLWTESGLRDQVLSEELLHQRREAAPRWWSGQDVHSGAAQASAALPCVAEWASC